MELASPNGYWRAVDVIELGREIIRRIAVAQAPPSAERRRASCIAAVGGDERRYRHQVVGV